MENEKKSKRRGVQPKHTIEELKEELDMWIKKRDAYKFERQLEHKKLLIKDKNAQIRGPSDKERECIRNIKNIRTNIYRRKPQ